ncbi:hypothetical protein [Legionella nagasakiensis]|uniref:hypothetical protein n=1 Tax=Legionella nagasakiensis TaxID=535290 RepID=UPI0010563AF6|nr:hypothetical protein [Legionella nagasakiensis]
MKLFLQTISIFIIVISSKNYASSDNSISVPVKSISHFQRSLDGNYVLNNGIPVIGEDEEYIFNTTFLNKNTAFVVIDPWTNMPDKQLNLINEKIIKKYILPLVEIAAKKGFSIYVFTNDCERLHISYSCFAPYEFYVLQKNNDVV